MRGIGVHCRFRPAYVQQGACGIISRYPEGNFMRHMIVRWFLVLAGLLVSSAVVRAQQPPILFQNPTVNATQIVFAYAGNLWTVPSKGGVAERLTAAAREDNDPIFSPDGTMLAFTGDDQGNANVYLMLSEGGMAKRLTWYPGDDISVGWTNDGKSVLFSSTRFSIDPLYTQLFTVPVTGGFPTALPLPWAIEGSYSPDGKQLVYVPFENHPLFEAWKHYRGGMESRIRIAQLSDSSVESMPRGEGNNQNPMWIGKDIYFLSDRTGGNFRLYRYQPGSNTVEAVSPNDGQDILSASAGALDTPHPEIVYTELGKLFLLDVKSGRVREVPVTVHADFPAAHPHWDTVGKELMNAGISPHGVRAVFQAHCDILTVPTKHGDAQDITSTPGACERNPAWSPDGKSISYFSDASGEYELYISPQDGIGTVQKISLGEHPSYYRDPVWSPDSSKIAYSDLAQRLWIVDGATGKRTLVATGYYDSDGAGFDPAWSADSKWLTYTAELPSYISAVFVYSVPSGQATQITDGTSDAELSRFDPSGKYLYFLASTNPNPGADVGELSAINQPTVYSGYVAVLRKDLPSPLAPQTGEEKAGAATTEAEGKPKEKEPAEAKPAHVTIDFEGLSQRILALPIPPRAYQDLEVSGPGVVWLAAGPVVEQSRPDHPALALYRFTLEDRKAEEVLPVVQHFVLSADGKQMLIEEGGHWRIVAAAAKVAPSEGTLNTDDLRVYVDPGQQWRQMYYEVWRIEREYFYSPQFNGLNLPAAEKYYAQFLPGVESRSDLDYLFHDMLGNFVVSHMFLGGSPYRAPKPIGVGMLGADYKIDHNRYQFTRIYSGENWNPDLKAPLTQPGINVKVGDYLLEVNGRPLYGTDDIFSFFQDTVGKQVVLRVGPNPDGTDARQVTVVPVDNDMSLRKWDWIHQNRMLVDKLSHGQLAYVYLPDTENGGWTYFNRFFFSQIGKQGVVVDERFNHGGWLANYVINELQQPLLSFISSRHGHLRVTPAAVFGPKVMIANHFAGSGGDYMPYIFKQQHVGPLVGTRTWGGLVGLGGYPPLMDGSQVTAPESAIYFPDGNWDVENHGVDPDVKVEMDPKLWRQGEDPQLQTAVSIALRELKAHPFQIVPRPAYPDYYHGATLGSSAASRGRAAGASSHAAERTKSGHPKAPN
jgi:tricorn protease